MLIPNAITLDGIRQTDNLAIIGICDSALYNKFPTAIASHKHRNSRYEHYDSLHIKCGYYNSNGYTLLLL